MNCNIAFVGMVVLAAAFAKTIPILPTQDTTIYETSVKREVEMHELE